jgi:hypothetical protein
MTVDWSFIPIRPKWSTARTNIGSRRMRPFSLTFWDIRFAPGAQRIVMAAFSSILHQRLAGNQRKRYARRSEGGGCSLKVTSRLKTWPVCLGRLFVDGSTTIADFIVRPFARPPIILICIWRVGPCGSSKGCEVIAAGPSTGLAG